MNLPPLPEPYAVTVLHDIPYYTADQMQAYGQLCRQQALEEAAQVCDRIFPSSERSGHEWSDGFVDGACDCSDAIRRLIK